MCIPSGSKVEAAPKAPEAPPVLEQPAPKKAGRDKSAEDKKRNGLKAYRSSLTIGTGSTVNSSGSTGVNIT